MRMLMGTLLAVACEFLARKIVSLLVIFTLSLSVSYQRLTCINTRAARWFIVVCSFVLLE
jgi:hypothetical protein